MSAIQKCKIKGQQGRELGHVTYFQVLQISGAQTDYMQLNPKNTKLDQICPKLISPNQVQDGLFARGTDTVRLKLLVRIVFLTNKMQNQTKVGS